MTDGTVIELWLCLKWSVIRGVEFRLLFNLYFCRYSLEQVEIGLFSPTAFHIVPCTYLNQHALDLVYRILVSLYSFTLCHEPHHHVKPSRECTNVSRICI